jgi:putative phage-type endonuclease
MTGLAATPIVPLRPGSAEWCREVTASKVSAILGLSPWQSRFAIWHELAGWLPPREESDATDQQARGHYLEPAIAAWWADQYGAHLRPGGCWRSTRYPWMVVSPDRLVVAHRTGRKPVSVLEVKSSGSMDGWGPDGSDEVPAYYRAQVVLQLDCLGLPRGHVAVLLPRLQFRAYTIEYDADEAAWMREQIEAFMATLPGGANERVPDIDGDDSTYATVRRIHPELDGEEIEVDRELAESFLTAAAGTRAMDSLWSQRRAEMGQAMGNASRAVHEGVVVATRQARGGGTPFVSAPKKLPELPQRIDTSMDDAG